VLLRTPSATAIAGLLVDRDGIVRLGRTPPWYLERVTGEALASLRPERYCDEARSWASVTPVFLDRFLKGKTETEEAELVARACTNIGLPEPFEVQIHKHSAIRGAETTYPARGDARRPDWSFPESATYRDKPRRHVLVRFRDPVTGPVILGSARFHGMGLCLPVADDEWVLGEGTP